MKLSHPLMHNNFTKSDIGAVSNLLKHKGVREVSKVYDNNRNVRCIIGTKL